MISGLNLGLLVALLVVTGFNWTSSYIGNLRNYHLSKPFVLFFLTLYFALNGGLTLTRLPILLGLIFSLLGDIFLISKGTRWFLAGMGVFSLAHLAYVVGLNLEPAVWWAYPLAVLLLLFYSWGMFRYVESKAPGVVKSLFQKRAFKAYGLVVALTALSGLLCLVRPSWSLPDALFVFVGGFLFLFSDLLIGYERLNKRSQNGNFWVIVSYHLGQFLICGACLLHTAPL